MLLVSPNELDLPRQFTAYSGRNSLWRFPDQFGWLHGSGMYWRPLWMSRPGPPRGGPIRREAGIQSKQSEHEKQVPVRCEETKLHNLGHVRRAKRFGE